MSVVNDQWDLAALRAPVFLGSLTHKTGRCAPPSPVSTYLLPTGEINDIFMYYREFHEKIPVGEKIREPAEKR